MLVKEHGDLGIGYANDFLKNNDPNEVLERGPIAVERAKMQGQGNARDNFYLSYLIQNSKNNKKKMDEYASNGLFYREIANFDLSEKMMDNSVSDKELMSIFIDRDAQGYGSGKEYANRNAYLDYTEWLLILTLIG